MFCKEQAAQLRAAKPEIEAAGGQLFFVGNGNVAFARDFKESFVPDCVVLTDPSTTSYGLLGTKRGIRSTLAPRTWVAGIRALTSGSRQSRTRGEARLLGGAAILDSKGEVRWRYLSLFAGDHPSTAVVLDALRATSNSRKA